MRYVNYVAALSSRGAYWYILDPHTPQLDYGWIIQLAPPKTYNKRVLRLRVNAVYRRWEDE